MNNAIQQGCPFWMLIERCASLLTLRFGSFLRLPRTSEGNVRKLRACVLSAPPRVTTSCGARTGYRSRAGGNF
jgi:hypothetical protein